MAAIEVKLRARSLPEKILYGVLLLALVVLGFFFLVAALAAGAILAAVVLIRLWWLKRRLRQAADAEILTTEYTVVERERTALPPADREEPR